LDRCALFVDANYALAEGALVVHGTRNRDSVSWDYAGILKLLVSLSRDRTGLPLLRCYWYDSAADGARAAEHDALADIPGIKLRLSKARPSRKEGVEAEIRKDLTALARNHAVTDIVIVSTEEDLAPVISEVQDLGIRVVLFHIATEASWAISRTLRQECDDLIEVGAAHLQPYVDLIAGAEPQLPAPGFRELAGAAVQSSGPHAAIEAPAVRLYSSQLTAEYEHAPVASAGQVPGMLPDAPRFGGHGDPLHSGPITGGRDSQPGLPSRQHTQGTGPSPSQPIAHVQGAHAQAAQDQLAHPSAGQAPQGQPPGLPAQGQQPPSLQPPGLQSPGLHSAGLQPSGLQSSGLQSSERQSAGQQDHGQQNHGQQPQDLVARVQQYQRSEAGSGHQPVGADPTGFGGQDIRGPLGQPSPPPSVGFDQRGGPDDGRGRHGSLGQSSPEMLNGAGRARLDQNGLDQGRFGRGQQAESQFGHAQFGQSQLGHNQAGQAGGGLPSGGLPANGMQARPGGPVGSQGNGMHAGGFQPHGQSPNGGPPNSMAPAGTQNGASANGMPANGMPANGLPPGPGVMPGQPPRGQSGGSQHQDPGLGQPGYGQPGVGQLPVDGQRAPLPPRQPPSSNGMPYAQDRSMPYGGPGQLAQLNGHGAPAAYGNSYGSQQSAVAPIAMSVGDAVQSAHAEGFGFGEAVARDAPALWLEAVLARKPRMPSDLEARLLQGSALPIDSLLHDEVRHALRRGFWDALERSRH
jgi:uncharacterized LabA/DUF88 family protein